MSWTKVKLGEFLKVRGERFKPNDKAISGLKRIDKIDFLGKIFISDKPSNTDMILIKKGDLVISGINVEKGAMAVYTEENDITATIHYSSYYFDENKIDIDFLKHFLKSPEFKKALKEQVPGGIKTEIKPKHLLPLLVEIPNDIQDQKKVVKLLQERNSKIEAISNELHLQFSLVKKLRQQFLREAIQGKLVAQNAKDQSAKELLKRIKADKEKLIKVRKYKKGKDFPTIKQEDIPFVIPDCWVWARFNDVAEIHSNLVSPFEFPDHPHIAPDNIEKNTGKLLPYNTVSKDKVQSANHYFYPGQLIYSKVRPKLNKIVKVSFEGLCSADMYPIKTWLDTDFLQYCMLSDFFLDEVDKFDNRVKMPKINQNQLAQIPIPVPPLAEQQRIVQKIKKLFLDCDVLEKIIKQNISQNQKLLQQVLREVIQPKQENQTRESSALVINFHKENRIQKPVLLETEENHFVKRKIIAAYIINQSLDDPKFGDVKFEKLLHLSDYFSLKRNLGQKYFQQAAGPYDNAFTIPFFKQVLKDKWFNRGKKGNQFTFSAGQNHSKSINTYDYFSNEELKRVDRIIAYFKKYDYEQPEIVSTLYAVWNNRIILQKEINDELLMEDFYAWDSQKKKYERNRLESALQWMREENLVPDGWGNLIEKSKSRKKR
ncbi:MAG: restriction endonuclease subunit S [Sporocytophaga sp.]|nr:restriction endonuclease subunit S [Sporocytophaga sp.]